MIANNENNNGPYMELEYRDYKKQRIYKDQSGSHPNMRRIYKRNVALCIIYSILTFGIYLLYWQYAITKESNKICMHENDTKPSVVVFFTIITIGIYGVFWAHRTGLKHNNFFILKKNEDYGYSTFYFVLAICNYIVPFMNIICLSFMQKSLNKMINISDSEQPNGVYVVDNSIFNRPIYSTILLFLLSMVVPQLIMNVYDLIFLGAPGNPANVSTDINGVMQTDTQNSADMIINCDTPFVVSHCCLHIFVILVVLWWFRMRFKNSGYNGVLVPQNFWMGILYALPGILFVVYNALVAEYEYARFGIFLIGFLPAFVEEITFRGMIIPNLMRIHNNSKGIVMALLIPSFIFSLSHMGNILAGADFGTTIFQVCYTLPMGMFWAAVLIRSGNLWPGVIVHGLVDSLSLMSAQALETGMIQTQEFTWSNLYFIIVAISVSVMLYSIWIVRPKKCQEITSLWAKKWGDAVLSN